MFHESSFPGPLMALLAPFRIFVKFAKIFATQDATQVPMTLAANLSMVSTHRWSNIFSGLTMNADACAVDAN